MKKKYLINLFSSIILLVLTGIILLFPILNVTNIKVVLTIIFASYALIKLMEYILTFESKDYESLFTFIISLGGCIASNTLTLTEKNIALIVLIWMGIMCLVKLKKADFYHDRKNKIWILRLFMLFVFLISGLLMGINFLEDTKEQIIVIGVFFFINSILDSIDPIVLYLMEKK